MNYTRELTIRLKTKLKWRFSSSLTYTACSGYIARYDSQTQKTYGYDWNGIDLQGVRLLVAGLPRKNRHPSPPLPPVPPPPTTTPEKRCASLKSLIHFSSCSISCSAIEIWALPIFSVYPGNENTARPLQQKRMGTRDTLETRLIYGVMTMMRA